MYTLYVYTCAGGKIYTLYTLRIVIDKNGPVLAES